MTSQDVGKIDPVHLFSNIDSKLDLIHDELGELAVNTEEILDTLDEISEHLENATQLRKDHLWLLYNMHVDKLDRSPSRFLTEGFTEICKNWNNMN